MKKKCQICQVDLGDTYVLVTAHKVTVAVPEGCEYPHDCPWDDPMLVVEETMQGRSLAWRKIRRNVTPPSLPS